MTDFIYIVNITDFQVHSFIQPFEEEENFKKESEIIGINSDLFLADVIIDVNSHRDIHITQFISIGA